jgi:hypothetical protein
LTGKQAYDTITRMGSTPTPAEITTIVRRVQALGDEARSSVLYGLLGRMMTRDMEAVEIELEMAERIEAGL